ncbi:hypothetical protein PoB_003934600 [Plakobranchus ocellatus]|uniref:Uncharacterized protein n=1 Tax=Plakobranchus ocellatus TaxID=259542 RepID=A0AAV4B1Z6_9GAST|nr:hypothetical protein PoB_003934600 [Plakobranchus ocellatus]
MMVVARVAVKVVLVVVMVTVMVVAIVLVVVDVVAVVVLVIMVIVIVIIVVVKVADHGGGWVGGRGSNRTRDRGDDNIDSGDVIVVMVKTIVVVAIYGGWLVDCGTDSGNGRSNVGGWVATVVVMILCSGRRGGGERNMIYTFVFMVQDFAANRNANSRLTKSTRFGKNEPTLYLTVTVSVYRISDSRQSLSALRSLIRTAIDISIVNQVIRPRRGDSPDDRPRLVPGRLLHAVKFLVPQAGGDSLDS